MMKNQAMLSVIGSNALMSLNQLSQNIANLGANILHSRLVNTGSEFACFMQIEGRWSALAKVESMLQSFGAKYELSINCKRMQNISNKQDNCLNYMLHLFSADREGILSDLTQFLISQEVDLLEVSAKSHLTANGNKVANLELIIQITPATHIASLREKFSLYCDALNLDASLEPVRD